MVQRAGFQPRLPMPPTSGIPPLDQWLRNLTITLNNLPRVSWFSGTHPNLSKITGTAGDLAINLASGSTDSRLWIMGGAPTFSATTGWVAIRTVAVP